MKQLNDRNKKRVKKQPQKIAFFYFNFLKREYSNNGYTKYASIGQDP